MLSRILVLLFAAALVWPATKKIVGSGRGENQDIILNITVYADADSVKEVIGEEMGGHYIVAKVEVQPKYGKEVSIDRDDFVLHTFKNGDRSGPMAPNQIAGGGALVLNGVNESVGEGSVPKRRWSIGGMGAGVASTGGPVRDPNAVKATVEDSDKESPLKKVLEDKQLPAGKLEKPISGLLYFPMERQKLKDLQMIYGAKETRIEIHFK